MNFLYILLIIIALYVWIKIIKNCNLFENFIDEVNESIFKFVDNLKKDFYDDKKK